MFDVQQLIDHWREVGHMAVGDASGQQAVSELSSLGEKKEVWQVFACLIGYSQETSKDMREILSQVPDNIQSDESPLNAAPFLEYCSKFKTVPIYEFLPALYFVKYKLSKMTILGCSTTQLQECIDRHRNDPDGYLKCIREAQNTPSEEPPRAQAANESW